uniref:Uncharacterized protein n=1 Tax=Arundo donax TaxID=35708 RepID=A0A0A9DVS2_ARUDO
MAPIAHMSTAAL